MSKWLKVRVSVRNRIAGLWVIVLVGVFGHAQRENIFSDWRPNSNTYGVRYVGSKACLDYHKPQHMPKVELPGMHASLTDHWIRIARPGNPVPR